MSSEYSTRNSQHWSGRSIQPLKCSLVTAQLDTKKHSTLQVMFVRSNSTGPSHNSALIENVKTLVQRPLLHKTNKLTSNYIKRKRNGDKMRINFVKMWNWRTEQEKHKAELAASVLSRLFLRLFLGRLRSRWLIPRVHITRRPTCVALEFCHTVIIVLEMDVICVWRN